MAENTIDTLSLQIESDAQKSFKSIDRLTSSLIGLGKATDRLNAKGLGNFSQDLKTFSSAIRGLKNVTFPDFSGITDVMSKLNDATFDVESINKVTKSLKSLASVDMGKFNGADFSQITSSIGQLANIPDVSNSLNRFVSSLQKLANAGDKITPVANELPRLGSSLRNAINTMAGTATVSESTNMFVQSIGRLATAGAKTTQTAAGLDALAAKTKDFFAAMQNAPQVSENTIRMTQALAQLASAGGNVGKATDSISSGFSKLSNVSSTLSNTVSKVSSAVTRAAKKMVSAFKNIGSSSKHVKTATFNLKSLLKTAVGFGALRGLFNLGKEAVEFSSDLTEVQNVVDVTFGNMAYKVEQLAKTSIGDFGMSELTLKQISSRFQAMGAAMGFSQSKMSDMSIELTKLAADMASFYNVEQADVAKALESIFTGQTRPLRTYGLDLTQATLKEWAMKNGLDSNIKSMTQLEKTMLRYQYVLANTGAAQGDFARTAGTWANQTRILKQNIQQLGGIIGQGLIAALLPAIKVLNVFMSGLTKIATLFRDFMYVLTGKKLESGNTGITNVLGDTEGYEDGIADAGDAAADALDGTSDKVKELKKNLDIADYDELRVLKKDADDAADSLGDLGDSGLGDTGISGDLPNMEDWLKNQKSEELINKWATRIRSAFLSKDWERLGRTVADGLNKGLKRLYDLLNWKKVGKKITGFTDGLTRTFNSLVDYFDWDLLGRTVGTGVNTVVNTLNQLIEGTDWKNLGRKFASGVNGLFNEVNWKNLGNLIGNKFMIAWNIFSGFVEDLDFAKVGKSLADLLSGAFEKIDLSTIGTSLAKAINGGFNSLLNFTRNFKWDDLRNNVSNGINNTLKTLDWKKAGQSLNEFLSDLGDFMLGVAKDVKWEEFGKGIADFLGAIDWGKHFNTVIEILKEVVGGIWEGLGDTFAGKVVQGIIAFKITSSTLLPFADGLAKAFTGKSLTQVVAGGVKGLLGGAFGESGILDGGMFSSLASAISPATVAIGALVTGLGYVYATNEEVQISFSNAVAALQTGFQPVLQTITDTIIPGLQSAWQGFIDIMEPFGDFLQTAFTSIWQDVLNPVLQYAGDTILPTLAETFTNLWNNVLVPLGEFLGSVFSPVIDVLSGALKTLWQNVVVPLADAVGGILSTAFEGIAQVLNNTVIPAVGLVVDAINALWKNVLSPIGTFLTKTFAPVFDSVFKGIGDLIEDLQGVFQGLIDFITGVFSGDWGKAWNGIKTAFSNAVGGLGDILKIPVNAAIGFLNGLINAVEWAVNSVANMLNHLNVQAPKWFSDLTGITSIGFNLPTWNAPNIPYLAKGGLAVKETYAKIREGKDDEAVLPLNDSVYERLATGITKNMPKLDTGSIEINRSQAPYVSTADVPRRTYSNSFGDDMRRDIAAISSNTFNNNTNIGQAVREALNGMAVVADGYIIGYIQSKDMEYRNQNGGIGILGV